MTPQLLMESFTHLLEGDKVVLNELEVAFLSELNISSLIQSEFTSYKKTTRIFDCWIKAADFIQLRKDEFIEDLSFISLSLATVGTEDLKIHQFIEFVLAPKLFIFAKSEKYEKVTHEEIVAKVLDNLAHAEV